MKVAIYCVNYHSYDSLNDYLDSIDVAVSRSSKSINLTVLIADNTTPFLSISYVPRHFSIHVIPTNENKGYFKAVRLLMEFMDPAGFDYAIVSNVDVLLSDDFFVELSSFVHAQSNIGWIAPEIYSKSLNFDFNPQAITRYSLRKLKALRFMFRYPWVLWLKQKLLHRYRKVKKRDSGQIYAGHGSFIILTNLFFQRCGIINYPQFLYGEEIYLAEVCRAYQLEVFYAPQIKVADIGRVSTRNIPSHQFCHYNHDAIDYIIKTFY